MLPKITTYSILIIVCACANSQTINDWEFAHNRKQYLLNFNSQGISNNTSSIVYDSVYARATQYNTVIIGSKPYTYPYFDSVGFPFFQELKSRRKRNFFPRKLGNHEVIQGYSFISQSNCNQFALFSINVFSSQKRSFNVWLFNYDNALDTVTLIKKDSLIYTSNYGANIFPTLYFQEDQINNCVWTILTYQVSSSDKPTALPIKIDSVGNIFPGTGFQLSIYPAVERGFHPSSRFYWYNDYSPTSSQAIFSRDFKKCYFSSCMAFSSANVLTECLFDKSTGKLSNEKILLKTSDMPRQMGISGIAVSPNDSFLYLATRERAVEPPQPSSVAYIIQFNRFNSNKYNLKSRGPYLVNAGGQFYYYPFISFMDFGPDGRLYFGNVGDQVGKEFYKIGYIANPNKWGAACNANFDWWTLNENPWLLSCGGRIGTTKGKFYQYNFQITNNNLCVDTTYYRIQVMDTFSFCTVFYGDGDSTILSGSIGTVFNLKHKYVHSGKYKVALKIKKPFCSQEQWAFDTAIVRFKPVFVTIKKITDSLACDNYRFEYLDSVKNAQSRLIDWGDGTKDSFFNEFNLVTKHTYWTRDSLNLKVTISNSDFCSSTMYLPVVSKFLAKPRMKLDFYNQGDAIIVDSIHGKRQFKKCNPMMFSLIDTISNNKYIAVYSMNTATKTFYKSGGAIKIDFLENVFDDSSKLHSLKVTDNNGCVASDTVYTKVLDVPKVNLTSSDTVICEATAFKAIGLKVHSPMGTEWSFRNTYLADSTEYYSGLMANLNTIWEMVPKKPLSKPTGWKYRVFKLVFTAVSSDGCTDSKELLYRVTTNPRSNFIISEDTICNGSFIKISDSSSNTYEPVKYLHYNFGNNDTGNAFGKFNYQYLKAGNYEVQQVVKTTENCVDSSSHQIVVKDFEPSNYSINLDKQCLKNNIITLDDIATKGNYRVDFGDSYITNNLPTNHSYLNSGKYLISTIKQWSSGCADTQKWNITIHKDPVAMFTLPLLCTDNPYQIKNNSTAGDTAFKSYWYESENGVSTTLDLSLLAKISGNHLVRLTVRDSFGCVDSMSKSTYVGPKPRPSMFYDGSEFDQSKGYSYYFLAKPDTFTKYFWEVGSAGSFSSQNPKVWFSESNRNEHVRLIVRTAFGCESEIDTNVFIKGLMGYSFPTAFTPNNDGKNDGFGIAEPNYIKSYKLWIFNRWGEQVFYTENPNIQWIPQNPVIGEYIYKAKVQDIYSRWKEVKGIVVLIK